MLKLSEKYVKSYVFCPFFRKFTVYLSKTLQTHVSIYKNLGMIKSEKYMRTNVHVFNCKLEKKLKLFLIATENVKCCIL